MYRRKLLEGLIGLAIVPMTIAPMATATDSPEDKVLRLDPPRAIANFSLLNQLGETVSWDSLRGEPMLVFFGFTSCPDVCPETLAKLKTLAAGKDADLRKVRVVMISIDGERDTPVKLKAYLAAVSPSFIGLTGDPRRVRDIASLFSAVFYKGQSDPKGNYDVEHTSQVYLIDRKGRMRAAFFNSPTAAIARVTKEIVRESG